MSTSATGPDFKKRTPPGVKPVQRQGQPSTPGGRPVQRDRLSWHQFVADPARYEKMPYRRSGSSGLSLPSLSLGSWETFGGYVGPEQARGCIFKAFNSGITHFDLANSYGSPRGRAEIMVGRVLRELPRAELVVATKAGFPMWPGPYGEGSSRKALLSSIDQSLHRLAVDYVDIFYSHRPDEHTPLEETLRALDQIVRQGKALYVGLSNYSAPMLAEACRIVRELNLAPITVTQVSYSMLRREIEQDLISVARQNGVGIVAFSALAQGVLSTRYRNGVPEGSRAARTWTPQQREGITPALQAKIGQLDEIAKSRGQTLPQMAIGWILRVPEVSTALIGASDPDQVEENVIALGKLDFTDEEFRRIDAVLSQVA